MVHETHSKRCQWQVIGSGTFDDAGRVLALENARREGRLISTHEFQCSVENSSLREMQTEIDHEGAKLKQPYYTDDCVCITEASVAPKYIMESLTTLESDA